MSSPAEQTAHLNQIFGSRTLAKYLKVSQRSVQRYVRGRHQPRPKTAVRLYVLIEVVAHLERHGYDRDDVRKWFRYGAGFLGYYSPHEIFARPWDTDLKTDPYVRRVHEHAQWGIRTTIPPRVCHQ